MEKNNIKKLIAIVLVVANIFATNSFNVLATGIKEFVADFNEEPTKNYYYLYKEEIVEETTTFIYDENDEENVDEENKELIENENDINSENVDDKEKIEENENIEEENDENKEEDLEGEEGEENFEPKEDEVDDNEEQVEETKEEVDLESENDTQDDVVDKEKEEIKEIEELDEGEKNSENTSDFDTEGSEKDEATNSEIKEENKEEENEKASKSEIEEEKQEETDSVISTSSEYKEVEEIATNSVVVSSKSETTFYIATYSKITWKIKSLEVATLSNINIYDSNGNADTKDNLAKTAKIRLINNLGEEKTIELDLKWNLYKHIEIATNSKTGIHKISVDVNWQKKNNMDKILETREAVIKATDSKLQLLEKIKQDEENKNVILIEDKHNLHEIKSRKSKEEHINDEKTEEEVETTSEEDESEESETTEVMEETDKAENEEVLEETKENIEVEEIEEIAEEDIEAFTNIDIEDIEDVEDDLNIENSDEISTKSNIEDFNEEVEEVEEIEEIELLDDAMQQEREIYISKENVESDEGNKDGFLNTEINVYELDVDAIYSEVVEILFAEINKEKEDDDGENVVYAIFDEDTTIIVPKVRANLFKAGVSTHFVCGDNCNHKYIEKHETAIQYNPLTYNIFATTSTVSHVKISGKTSYYLVSDIIINSAVEVMSGAELNLCTSGYNITFEYNGYIYGNGKFNLTNCNTDKKSMIYGTYTDNYVDIYGNVDTGGKPITRYRAKPFADVDYVGVYAPNKNIAFENIRTINWYNNEEVVGRGLMEDRTADHPSSTNAGGALFKGNSGVELSNLSFKNIYSERNNGTIANSKGKMIVESCEFDTLESVENAAALCFNTGDTIIYNSNFKVCKSGGDGGALYGKYQSGSNGTLIKNCNFNNCEGYRGGAIGLESFSKIDLEDITFYKNKAKISGGAIYLCIQKKDTRSGVLNINNNVKFDENTAEKSSGGAIHFDTRLGTGEYTINLNDAEFTKNMVKGIEAPIYNPDVRKDFSMEEWYSLDKTTRDKNKIDSYYSSSYGGAITAKGNVKLNVGLDKKVTFEENEANTGGTIFLSKGAGRFSDVSIKNGKYYDKTHLYTHNSGGGGAIYAMDGASVDIGTKSEMSNNFNSLYALDATYNITNSKLTGNNGNYLIGYSNKASNNIKFKDFTLKDQNYTDGDDVKYDYYEIQKAMIDNEREGKEGKEEFKKSEYYLKTTIQFEGNVNIKGNTQRIAGNRTEADIYYNDNSIKLDFSKTKFETESKIGLYLEAEERVIIDYWNKANVLEYNQGINFNERFYLNNRSAVSGWKFYRDNEKIYVGKNYNTVHFDFIVNGAPKNPSDQYIYNKSTGSYLDKPKELVDKTLSAISNHTFIGFIGYVDGSDKPYTMFDFETSKALPTTSDRQYYYGIYTNDTVKCKACGVMNGETCKHVETTIQHKNRGEAPSNSEEAKYLNYVVVATAAQLFYMYNNKHTQYILEKDIVIHDNLPSIKSGIVINLAGHKIYSNKRNSSFISLESSESPVVVEDDNTNVFLTSSKYSTESNASIGSGSIDFRNTDGEYAFSDINGKKMFVSNMIFENLTSSKPHVSPIVENGNFDSASDKIHLENVVFRNINAKLILLRVGNITLDKVTINGITTTEQLFQSDIYTSMTGQQFIVGGNTTINNNTLRYGVFQFKKPKLIIASDANVTINNNTIEYTHNIMSAVSFSNEVELNGNLSVCANTVNFTGDTSSMNSDVISGVYHSKDAKVTFGGGGLKVIDNKTTKNTKITQYYVNRLTENMLTTPIFYQKEGVKFSADNTEMYLYVDNTESEQLIYKNYCEDTVLNFANSENAQLINTFKLDTSYGDTIKIYNVSNDNDHIGVMMGKDFVKVNFILDQGSQTIQIDTQYVKKGQNAILERPFNGRTTELKNGVLVYRSMFYEGPTKDYLTSNRLKVYSNDFNNNIVNMTEEFNVYAYYSDQHNHTTAMEPFIEEEKSYWIQARKANHLNCVDGCIYLSNDMVISEPLYETPKDKFSICLNGHTLTFENGINWFTENEDVNITITDCKGTGTIKGNANVFTETLIDMSKGTLNLSKVNFANMKIQNDLIKVSADAKINVNKVTFGSKGANEIQNKSSLMEIKGKAYIDDLTVKNNTYENSPLIIYNFGTDGNVVKNNTISTNTGGVVPIIFDTKTKMNIEKLIVNSNYLVAKENVDENLLASAVVFKGIEATISNLTVSSNTVSRDTDKGAIYVYDSAKIVLDGVNTVNGNTLKTYAAFNIEKDSSLDIIGTLNASTNKSSGNYGTVLSLVATPNVTERYNLKVSGVLNITNNTVNDTGAIYISGGKVVAGGKIIVENNKTTINNTYKNIVLNKASDYLYGNTDNKLKDGSKLYITKNVSDTKVFESWSKDYIEDFNKKPYYNVDKLFFVDNSSTNQNIHIYKLDESNVPKLYIGTNCVKLTYRDSSKKVLFTQYIAKDILTTIEKVEFTKEEVNLEYAAQWWKVPDSANEKATKKIRFMDYEDGKYQLKVTRDHNIDLIDFRTKIVYEQSIPVSPLGEDVNVILSDTYEQYVTENETIVLENPNYNLKGYELVGFATSSVSVDTAESSSYVVPFKVGDSVEYNRLFTSGMIDKELYCVWRRKTITLTININDSTYGMGSTTAAFTGGTTIRDKSTINVKYDTQISGLPESGSRTGYTKLLGFASISNIPASEKTTSDLVFKNGNILRIAESKEIYAIWQNNESTCYINLQGGEYEDEKFRTPDSHKFKVYFDEKYFAKGNEGEPKDENGNLLIPIREGYEFHFYTKTTKFNDDKFGGLLTKEEDELSRELYDIKDAVHKDSANVTLYATWTPSVYEVTFNGNGGKVTDGKITTTSITYKLPYSYKTGLKGMKPYTLPTAINEGYQFVNWTVNTASDKGEVLKEGTGFFLDRKATTVYAQWEELYYNLVYQSNVDDKTVKVEEIAYAEMITIKTIEETGFTNKNGVFRYWFISSIPTDIYGKNVLSSNILKPGDTVNKLSKTRGGTVYLKAVWDNQYIVHYKPNGHHSETYNYDMIFTKGQSALVQKTYSDTDYYEFKHYNTVADDSGVKVTVGTNANNLTQYSVDGVITLYCVWKALPIRNNRRKGGSSGGGGGSNASQVGTTGLGSVYTGTEIVSLIVNSINGLVTALDGNGNPVTGWKYMYNDDGANYYHFNAYGKLDTGWYSEDGNLYYLDPENGKLVVGETYVNGILYNFKEDGALDLKDTVQKQKALAEIVKTINQPIQEIDIKVYEEGKWEYDQKSDNWKFYVLDSNGKKNSIKNDWFEVYKDGKEYWYLTDVDGNMMKGWVHSNGSVYYLREQGNEIGTMVKGMNIINNETYAFDENGKYIDDLTRLGDINKLQQSLSMVHSVAFATDVMEAINKNIENQIAILNNQNLAVEKNNVVEESDITREGYWKYDVNTNNWSFYLTEKYADGTKVEKAAKGWTVIDGEYYCFDEKGGLITGLVEYEGNYYYLDENPERRGRMFTGTLEYEGNTLYFDPYTGKLVVK